MSEDEAHNLGNAVSLLRPGDICRALRESSDEDREAVLRVYRRAKLDEQMRADSQFIPTLFRLAERKDDLK